MNASTFRRLVNLWPPMLFAGIRCVQVSEDYRSARIRLKLHWFNRNWHGTHFGGSLFAMTDPWHVLLMSQRLGPDYLVWDQRASIEFVKPGRGSVWASVRIDDKEVERVRENTRQGEKFLPEYTIDVLDDAGEVIARVRKTLYVRLKREAKPARQPEAASPTATA
jgi:acyl-coenzyme A thioesterase PaaI-like protein